MRDADVEKGEGEGATRLRRLRRLRRLSAPLMINWHGARRRGASAGRGGEGIGGRARRSEVGSWGVPLHRRGASQVPLGAITEVPLGAVRRRQGRGGRWKRGAQ